MPVVTIPLTQVAFRWVLGSEACVAEVTYAYFGGPMFICQDGPVILALAPGVLNLVPILWLRSHSPKTRVAAATATVLGALRLLVPAVAVVSSWPTNEYATGFLLPADFPNENSPVVEVVAGAGISLWLMGLIAMAVLARVDLHRNHAAR